MTYFRYEIDPDRYFEATPSESGYDAAVVEIPYTESIETLTLTLTDCLYCDAEQAGWDPNVLWQLAEDVYAWDIDFDMDIRPGDTFAVSAVRQGPGERNRALRPRPGRGRENQRRAAPGDLLRLHRLQGRGEGRLLRPRRAVAAAPVFCARPLKYRRISSRFTYRRRHPILRTVRPHLGVDFAAPSGTIVRAAADGTVIFRGRNGGFGNFIKLRHANDYETWYGHLKGYAKGIVRGRKVKQGQVIGYVGTTGLSTGPHLDYRMKHRGTMVNPLTQKFLPGKPLPADQMDRFRETAAGVLIPLGLPEVEAAKLAPDTTEPAPDEPQTEG